MKLLVSIQRRAIKMVKGLEVKTYEEPNEGMVNLCQQKGAKKTFGTSSSKVSNVSSTNVT